MTTRLGTVPTMAERMALVEHQLAEAWARIGVLEAKGDAEDAVDGPGPGELSSSWRPIKSAAAAVGYSESGLRAAMKRHPDGPKWWRYRAGRLLVNVDACPRKQKRT
jgi:hypothetical protein